MYKKKNKTKKKILILITFILSIISTISIGIIALMAQRKSTEETYRKNVEQLMFIVSQTIEDKVNVYENDIKSLYLMSDFTNLKALQQDLKLLAQTDETITDIYFCDEATGNLTSSLDYEVSVLGVKDSRTLEWYKNVMKDPDKSMVTYPYKDVQTGKLISTMFKAVVLNNKKMGVLALDVDLSSIQEELSVFKYGETGELEITDTYGNVIANRDQSRIGSNEPSEYPVWDEISSNKSGSLAFTFNSIEYEGYYTSYSPLGWIMILKNNVSELRSYEHKVFIKFMIIMIILIASEIIVFLIFLKLDKTDKSKKSIDTDNSEIKNEKLDVTY